MTLILWLTCLHTGCAPIAFELFALQLGVREPPTCCMAQRAQCFCCLQARCQCSQMPFVLQVKTDNVVVDGESGDAMLLDFGLAIDMHNATPRVCMGTPGYLVRCLRSLGSIAFRSMLLQCTWWFRVQIVCHSLLFAEARHMHGLIN